MNINDLKIDTIINMTAEMHRIFIAGGCNPTCHCCNNKIKINEKYKLASVSSELINSAPELFRTLLEHEVMLCESVFCSPGKMVENYLYTKSRRIDMHDRYNERETFKKTRAGCFIIDGIIVP